MSRKTVLVVTLILVASIVLSACAPEVVTENVEVEKEVTREVETEVTREVEKEVTREVETVVTATPEPAAEAEPVTLKILHNWTDEDPNGPPMQAVLEGFQEAYPHVTIEQEIIADVDIPARVETAFLGGEEPDLIFQNYLGDALAWMDQGVTIPVGDLMEEWEMRDIFLDAAIDQWTQSGGENDGKIAAFPQSGFHWPIWYNTAIFEEAGVEIPTTFDELLPASEAIRAAGYQPFAIGGGDWTGERFSQMFVCANMTEDEASKLFAEGGFSESANALAAMEAYVQMRDGGVMADDFEGLDMASMNELFFAGQAAMMHAGSWSYANLPEEMVDDVYLGGFPLLDTSPYDKPFAWAGFTAKGIHITRNGTQKLDTVRLFIEYFYSTENVSLFVEEAANFPTTNNTEVDEAELAPLFAQSLSLPERVTFVFLAELSIPAGGIEPALEGYAPEYHIPNGLTAEEILAGFDEIYDQLLIEE